MKKGLLILLLTAGLAQAEDELASPIDIAPVDVEANVRRMLEEARARQQGESPTGSAVQDDAPVPIGAAPVAPPPAQAVEEHKPAMADEGIRRAPVLPVDPDSDAVPMPDMTITVRSVGDVQTVSKELEAARQKKSPGSSSTEEKSVE